MLHRALRVCLDVLPQHVVHRCEVKVRLYLQTGEAYMATKEEWRMSHEEFGMVDDGQMIASRQLSTAARLVHTSTCQKVKGEQEAEK